jgi:hypothetical protein
LWAVGYEWFLDIETVLKEDESRVRVVPWQRRSDKIKDSRLNVRYVFRCQNNVVKRWKSLSKNIRDGVSD